MLELENGYESILQTSHVSKNDGNGCVLKDVCISFSPKGIHGILGPKKSGKSTLMDLLAFCEEADEGEILLRGLPLDQKNKSWKAEIGYVPQTPDFYEKMTVLEILDFVGETRGVSADKRYRQIKEALSLLEMETAQNALIASLTPMEKRRVALAAALLGNPQILLLDEPAFFEKRSETVSLIQMLGGAPQPR